jgi:hypothetical protein
MLLTELQSKDRYGAFSDYLTMEETKALGKLSKPLHEFLADKCDCGSEIIVAANLKRHLCCNPWCFYKVGKLMYKTLQNTGCKNIGVETCLSLAKHAHELNELEGHVSLILKASSYEFDKFKGAMKNNYFLALQGMMSQELSFPDMMTKVAVPSFKEGAYHIFAGIKGIKDLVAKIEDLGSVGRFMYSRGVEDVSKCFYLETYLMEILKAETSLFINKVPTSNNPIFITMTGDMELNDVWISKEEFLKRCNALGRIGNISLFDIRNTAAVQSNRYIVSTKQESTAKLSAAIRREEAYRRAGQDIKVVYHPDEFYALMKGIADGVKEAYKRKEEESGEQ